MAVKLKNFVAGLYRKPFQYGKCDCYLVLADWAKEVTGIDAADDLRDKYTDPDRYRQLIKERGGLVAMMDSLTAKVGWERKTVFADGDIGILKIPTVRDLVGGILHQGSWVMKLHTGVQGISQRILKPEYGWGPCRN